MRIQINLCTAYLADNTSLYSNSCCFNKLYYSLCGPDNYLTFPPKINKILNLPHE